MLANFLKVTIRNLYHEKMYAVINIAGLSMAITCCLILGLWLRSELTYDRHNIDHKQIFRIVVDANINGKLESFAATSQVLGPMLAEEYPEIKRYVRFKNWGNILIHHGDKKFYWRTAYITDNNVFEVFTHNILYGDPKTALADPTSCAVSESFAKKYFGNSNPIGETISCEGDIFKITLVFADLPENSHLKYDALFSYNLKELATPDNVTLRNQMLLNLSDYTYLLMPEGYDAKDFKNIFEPFFKRHMAETLKALNVTGKFWLQPLADIHLKSDVGYDLPTGNRLYIYGFAAVAIFIVLVACINYINLATARAAKRAKEVGMRKILGAGRTDLMLQFLCESIFFSFIAMFFSIVIVELILKLTPINELLNKHLILDLNHEPVIFGGLLIFSLVMGLLAGVYPALYLSSMLALPTLVKTRSAGKKNIRLREILVLTQFIISVSVIACALLMSMQMRYVSHKSLGFNKENRLIITLQGADLYDKLSMIQNELEKNSNILGISTASSVIGRGLSLTLTKVDNNDGVLEDTELRWMSVDDDYLKVMGMSLIAGRDFSKKLLTDIGTSYIVNEALVKKMGWKDPLGKRIQMYGDNASGRVIGVVEDFHFESLHRQIDPFAFLRLKIDTKKLSAQARVGIRAFLVLHISGNDIPGTLAFLQEKFAEFDPDHPFRYEFLDESLDELYLTEASLMKLIGIFAGICILISCMGLFGLAAFTTEQRTKEIGIRKVLGATTWQIISMLSRKILLLVLCGALIGSLIAYYAMDEWLTEFAYRIGINPMVFLFSALVAAIVAFITIALQSYKTARTNPVEALRYE